MSKETERMIEQTAMQAPKEFVKVKRRRDLLGLAMFIIFAMGSFFENYLEQSISACGSVMLQILIIVVLFVWLRENWKCPVCYKMPGHVLSNPRFCNECGTKLEE